MMDEKDRYANDMDWHSEELNDSSKQIGKLSIEKMEYQFAEDT